MLILAKNLYNFETLQWKLENPYYHIGCAKVNLPNGTQIRRISRRAELHFDLFFYFAVCIDHRRNITMAS